MNRQQAKELLPIIQAFAEGKEVEIKGKESDFWDTLEEDDMQYIDFKKCDLRIKPTYRPFENYEECWKEMQKHQPFGWIKTESNDHFYYIVEVKEDGCIFGNANRGSFDGLFRFETFFDGTPFGIKD